MPSVTVSLSMDRPTKTDQQRPTRRTISVSAWPREPRENLPEAHVSHISFSRPAGLEKIGLTLRSPSRPTLPFTCAFGLVGRSNRKLTTEKLSLNHANGHVFSLKLCYPVECLCDNGFVWNNKFTSMYTPCIHKWDQYQPIPGRHQDNQ